jgi:predicted GNAT family acetyltransferase
MDIDTAELRVDEEPERSRYVVHYEGQEAELTYRRRPGVITLLHTGVPRELEGHGIAGRLARYALDQARVHGLAVIPSCPYVRAYIERHPEYESLVRR